MLRKFRVAQRLEAQGRLDCDPARGELAPHQLIVYEMARLYARRAGQNGQTPPDRHRGLLAWHNTGSGKTLTAVAIMRAFWETGCHIYLVTTPSNQVGNETAKYVDMLETYFGDFVREYRGTPAWPGETPWWTKEDPGQRTAGLRTALGFVSGGERGQGTVGGSRVKRTTYEMLANQLLRKFATSAQEPDLAALRAKGVVFIFDEVHNVFAAKHRDLLRLMMTPGFADHRVLAFGLSATPGTSVDEWLGALSIVRPAGTPPYRPASPMNFEQFRGMVSFVDMSRDRSRHARMEAPAEEFAEMDAAYTAAYVAAYGPTMHKRAEYDPANPMKFKAEAKRLSDYLDEKRWRDWYSRDRIEGMLARGTAVRLPGSDKAVVPSAKLARVVSNLGSMAGKQYAYSAAAADVLAAMLVRAGWQRVDASSLQTNLGDPVGRWYASAARGARRFVLYEATASASVGVNTGVISLFNDPRNARGAYVKAFLATGPYYEGIDLKALRGVHVVEPMPNQLMDKQVAGRGSRNCGHADLDHADRTVTVVRYYSVVDRKMSPEAVRAMHPAMSAAAGRAWEGHWAAIMRDKVVVSPGRGYAGSDLVLRKQSMGHASERRMMAFEERIRRVAVDGLLLHERLHRGMVDASGMAGRGLLALQGNARFREPGNSLGGAPTTVRGGRGSLGTTRGTGGGTGEGSGEGSGEGAKGVGTPRDTNIRAALLHTMRSVSEASGGRKTPNAAADSTGSATRASERRNVALNAEKAANLGARLRQAENARGALQAEVDRLRGLGGGGGGGGSSGANAARLEQLQRKLENQARAAENQLAQLQEARAHRNRLMEHGASVDEELKAARAEKRKLATRLERVRGAFPGIGDGNDAQFEASVAALETARRNASNRIGALEAEKKGVEKRLEESRAAGATLAANRDAASAHVQALRRVVREARGNGFDHVSDENSLKMLGAARKTLLEVENKLKHLGSGSVANKVKLLLNSEGKLRADVVVEEKKARLLQREIDKMKNEGLFGRELEALQAAKTAAEAAKNAAEGQIRGLKANRQKLEANKKNADDARNELESHILLELGAGSGNRTAKNRVSAAKRSIRNLGALSGMLQGYGKDGNSAEVRLKALIKQVENMEHMMVQGTVSGSGNNQQRVAALGFPGVRRSDGVNALIAKMDAVLGENASGTPENKLTKLVEELRELRLLSGKLGGLSSTHGLEGETNTLRLKHLVDLAFESQKKLMKAETKKEKLKNAIKQLQEEAKQRTSPNSGANAQRIDGLRTELAEAQKKVTELTTEKKIVDGIAEQLLGRTGNGTRATATLLANLAGAHGKLVGNHGALQRTHEQLKGQLETLRGTHEQLVKNLAAAVAERNRRLPGNGAAPDAAGLKEARERVEALEKQIQEVEASKTRATKKLTEVYEEIGKAHGKYNGPRPSFENQLRRLRNSHATVAAVRTALGLGANNDVTGALTKLVEAGRRLEAELASAKQQLHNLDAIIEGQGQTNSEKNRAAAALENRITELTGKLAAVSTALGLGANNDVTGTLKKLVEAKKKLESDLEGAVKSAENLTTRLTASTNAHGRATSETARLEKNVREKAAQIVDMKAKLGKVEAGLAKFTGPRDANNASSNALNLHLKRSSELMRALGLENQTGSTLRNAAASAQRLKRLAAQSGNRLYMVTRTSETLQEAVARALLVHTRALGNNALTTQKNELKGPRQIKTNEVKALAVDLDRCVHHVYILNASSPGKYIKELEAGMRGVLKSKNYALIVHEAGAVPETYRHTSRPTIPIHVLREADGYYRAMMVPADAGQFTNTDPERLRFCDGDGPRVGRNGNGSGGGGKGGSLAAGGVGGKGINSAAAAAKPLPKPSNAGVGGRRSVMNGSLGMTDHAKTNAGKQKHARAQLLFSRRHAEHDGEQYAMNVNTRNNVYEARIVREGDEGASMAVARALVLTRLGRPSIDDAVSVNVAANRLAARLDECVRARGPGNRTNPKNATENGLAQVVDAYSGRPGYKLWFATVPEGGNLDIVHKYRHDASTPIPIYVVQYKEKYHATVSTPTHFQTIVNNAATTAFDELMRNMCPDRDYVANLTRSAFERAIADDNTRENTALLKTLGRNGLVEVAKHVGVTPESLAIATNDDIRNRISTKLKSANVSNEVKRGARDKMKAWMSRSRPAVARTATNATARRTQSSGKHLDNVASALHRSTNARTKLEELLREHKLDDGDATKNFERKVIRLVEEKLPTDKGVRGKLVRTLLSAHTLPELKFLARKLLASPNGANANANANAIRRKIKNAYGKHPDILVKAARVRLYALDKNESDRKLFENYDAAWNNKRLANRAPQRTDQQARQNQNQQAQQQGEVNMANANASARGIKNILDNNNVRARPAGPDIQVDSFVNDMKKPQLRRVAELMGLTTTARNNEGDLKASIKNELGKLDEGVRKKALNFMRHDDDVAAVLSGAYSLPELKNMAKKPEHQVTLSKENKSIRYRIASKLHTQPGFRAKVSGLLLGKHTPGELKFLAKKLLGVQEAAKLSNDDAIRRDAIRQKYTNEPGIAGKAARLRRIHVTGHRNEEAYERAWKNERTTENMMSPPKRVVAGDARANGVVAGVQTRRQAEQTEQQKRQRAERDPRLDQIGNILSKLPKEDLRSVAGNIGITMNNNENTRGNHPKVLEALMGLPNNERTRAMNLVEKFDENRRRHDANVVAALNESSEIKKPNVDLARALLADGRRHDPNIRDNLSKLLLEAHTKSELKFLAKKLLGDEGAANIPNNSSKAAYTNKIRGVHANHLEEAARVRHIHAMYPTNPNKEAAYERAWNNRRSNENRQRRVRVQPPANPGGSTPATTTGATTRARARATAAAPNAAAASGSGSVSNNATMANTGEWYSKISSDTTKYPIIVLDAIANRAFSMNNNDKAGDYDKKTLQSNKAAFIVTHIQGLSNEQRSGLKNGVERVVAEYEKQKLMKGMGLNYNTKKLRDAWTTGTSGGTKPGVTQGPTTRAKKAAAAAAAERGRSRSRSPTLSQRVRENVTNARSPTTRSGRRTART